MTAATLISNLRAMGNMNDLETCLFNIAAHLDDLRLRDGRRVLDRTDFKVLLSELAEACAGCGGCGGTTSRNSHWPREIQSLARSVDLVKFCPRCGHVHEGFKECGSEIGAGRICHCELEVPA